jgi:hypothetical protein
MRSHPEAYRLCRHLDPDWRAVSTFNSGQHRCKLFKGSVLGEVEQHSAALEKGMNSLPGGVLAAIMEPPVEAPLTEPTPNKRRRYLKIK